jgi:hypothetical protein
MVRPARISCVRGVYGRQWISAGADRAHRLRLAQRFDRRPLSGQPFLREAQRIDTSSDGPNL